MSEATKIKRYGRYDVTAVEDLIAMTAANIEDAYRMAGVKDYTPRECVDRAADVVLTRYFQDFDVSKLTLRSETT